MMLMVRIMQGDSVAGDDDDDNDDDDDDSCITKQ
jgi:hypothetical protein